MTAASIDGVSPESWEPAIAGFLSALEAAGKSPATIRQHRSYLVRLAADFESPALVTDQGLLDWVVKQGGAPRTMKTARDRLRPFFAWAAAEGLVDHPMAYSQPSRCQGITAAAIEVPHASPEWAVAIDDFGAHLARSSRSPATRSSYLQHVGWLAESVEVGPWDLTVHRLATWLQQHGWSDHTRRKVVVSLRTFYAWAVAEGHVEWSPTAGLPSGQKRRPGPERTPLPPAWVEPFEAFVSYCRGKSLSEATIEQRRWYVSRLARNAADPWSVSAEQLSQWIADPDWKPETKRQARGCARAFYGWARRVQRIEHSPADDLDSVRVPRALPRPAPHAVLRTALAGADDRTRLMLMLAIYGGLRRAEIARLHTHQVSETGLLVVGKGGHHRMVPLHRELAQELRAEMARRRRGELGSGWSGRFVSESGYLFPSFHHPEPITAATVGKIISRTVPDGWTCHTLRHRFATDAYATSRDLRAVQELLGHAKPETTARYAAVPDGALRSAVDGVCLS